MTQVKICGLTNLEDAIAAAAAGADLLGFIFYPPSPRFVAAEDVQEIVSNVRWVFPAMRCVGVFVNQTPISVLQTAQQCRLDTVQLHGAEPPEAAVNLMEAGLNVFRVIRVHDANSLESGGQHPATAYLLDTYVPGQMGGTGQSFDWSLAKQFNGDRPVILAGGLTPENVAQAVQIAQPWGVDVSSGVEAEPGRKDHHKLREFVLKAKGETAEAPTLALDCQDKWNAEI